MWAPGGGGGWGGGGGGAPPRAVAVAEPVCGGSDVCPHFQHARVRLEKGAEDGVLLPADQGRGGCAKIHGRAYGATCGSRRPRLPHVLSVKKLYVQV